VLALDDVIAGKGRLSHTNTWLPTLMPIGETLVVAVMRTHGVGLIAVLALKGEGVEEAEAIGRDAAVLLSDHSAIEAERVLHHVDDRVWAMGT
jgi:hypothetical protein